MAGTGVGLGVCVEIGFASIVARISGSTVAPISGARVGVRFGSAASTAAATGVPIATVEAGVGGEAGGCVAQPVPINTKMRNANAKERWFMAGAYGNELYRLVYIV